MHLCHIHMLSGGRAHASRVYLHATVSETKASPSCVQKETIFLRITFQIKDLHSNWICVDPNHAAHCRGQGSEGLLSVSVWDSIWTVMRADPELAHTKPSCRYPFGLWDGGDLTSKQWDLNKSFSTHPERCLMHFFITVHRRRMSMHYSWENYISAVSRIWKTIPGCVCVAPAVCKALIL